MELHFVTSNKGKVSEAEKILGKPITIVDLDLSEIQSLDIHKIVYDKVTRAFEKVQKPVFVDDVGLFVEIWNGFPGPFIKFMRLAGQTENDLLLRMLANETNRNVIARDVIGFYDGQEVKTFEGEVKGVLTNEERGNHGWGFDPIFQPSGSNQTFAEMGESEKNKISHRHNALLKFKEFLQNYS